MSRTKTAKLAIGAEPTVGQVNAALKRANLPLTVGHEWQDPDHEGYVACTPDGEEAGFERKRSSTSDGRLLLTLRWGGDQREHAAQLGVLFVLASECDAVILDPETGTSYGASELVRAARDLMSSLKEIEG